MSEYRMNKIHGILLEDDRVPEIEKKINSVIEDNSEIEVEVELTIPTISSAISGYYATVDYKGEDKLLISNFIKAQKGIIKLKCITPLGNLGLTLRPSLTESKFNTYGFEGSSLLEVNLTSVGGSSFNQLIVRAVTWEEISSIDFRVTILPITRQ